MQTINTLTTTSIHHRTKHSNNIECIQKKINEIFMRTFANQKMGLRHPSVNVDAFATSTPCCDPDLQNLTRSSVWASGYSL